MEKNGKNPETEFDTSVQNSYIKGLSGLYKRNAFAIRSQYVRNANAML